MSKFLVFRTASAITLMFVLIGAYQPASAQLVATSTERADASVDADLMAPVAVASGHVLVNTYLRQGNFGGLSPANTFTGLDKVITVSCQKGPCSISAVLAVQSGNATTLNNHVAIGFAVDGTRVSPCFALGEATPVDATYINSMQTCSIGGLPTGNHKLQIEYYSDNGAYVYEWAATYTLYTP